MGPSWRKAREWNDVNDFMDHERALHKKCNRIIMADFEQDETLCGYFGVNGGHY